MENDIRQANILSKEYDRQIADKDHDSAILGLICGLIGSGVFIAIVSLIVAIVEVCK